MAASLRSAPPSASPTPLTRAHAHNDYEHPRPLLDALDQGFCSVEADIYLVDHQLLVGHNRSDLRPERTLEKLYLEPLLSRFRKNGGRIYPHGPSVILLVDIKSTAGPTYAALKERLGKYARMLTRFHGDSTETNAVTVILSGNRPRAELFAERDRLAAYDGRIPDLDSGLSASFIPLVSADWNGLFAWRGSGPMPASDAAKLKDYVARAHAQGRKIRFWAAPDNPAAWSVLFNAGVDLINTDRLAELRQFLSAPSRPEAGH